MLDPGDGGEHVGDLAAAFALGALEPDERARVERHRRRCRSCDRLLVDEARVVALLPLAVPSAPPPPPDVKLALFARVAHAGRIAGEARPAALAGPWSEALPTQTLPASRPAPVSAPPPRVAASPPRPRRWSGWATALLAVPLLLALAGTGTWAVRLQAVAEEREDRADSLGATLDRVLADDGAVYPLSAGPAAPWARGALLTDADQQSATLVVKNVEAAPGQRYELFANYDGQQVVLTEVTVDDRGRGATTFALKRPLADYRLVRVRTTPAAGSNAGDARLILSGPVIEAPTARRVEGAAGSPVAAPGS